MKKTSQKTEKIKAAICGGSGYTGAELLRLLYNHPLVRITAVTSEKSAGKKIIEVFPSLPMYKKLRYEHLRFENLLQKADVFFLALPHGASQEAVHFFYRNKKTVIDLSADYRLVNPATYRKWYGLTHKYLSTLKKAVYGLPEINRSKIRGTRLVANPGCYPTGAVLGLFPAIKKKAVDVSGIVIDSKSGASGAGKKADSAVSFCEINGGFRAYGIGTHRHTPEIEQEISILAGSRVKVNFTPHLIPVNRGILTTIYAPLKKNISEKELFDIYNDSYKEEHFINVLGQGEFPDIKAVQAGNFCHIGLKVNKRTNTLIIVTAIDNLVKGASGQAVQNMNIMTGLDEKTGLDTAAVYP